MSSSGDRGRQPPPTYCDSDRLAGEEVANPTIIPNKGGGGSVPGPTGASFNATVQVCVSQANIEIGENEILGVGGGNQSSDYERIGELLWKLKCGGFVKLPTSGTVLFYVKPPPTPELAIVKPGVVLPQVSLILRSLCEMHGGFRVGHSKWRAQRRGGGRIKAFCSHNLNHRVDQLDASLPNSVKDETCKAAALACPLQTTFSGQDETLILRVVRDATSRFCGEDALRDGKHSAEFCVVRSSAMDHTGHDANCLQVTETSSKKREELPLHEEIVCALVRLCKISNFEDLSIRNVHKYVTERFPDRSTSLETVSMFLAKMNADECSSRDLLKMVSEYKDHGQLEFCISTSDRGQDVRFCAWSLPGSQDLAMSFGEFAYWDTWQNDQKTLFKLSALSVVDSHKNFRPVMFSLMRDGDEVDCKMFLVSWLRAFQQKLPRVLYSDGREGIYSVIASLPEDVSIKHLLCTYQLFDVKVRGQFQSVFGSVDIHCTWNSLRGALFACRDATSEEELCSHWEEIMRDWFSPWGPLPVLRKFMEDVWRKRKQWARAYLRESSIASTSSNDRESVCLKISEAFEKSASVTELFRSLVCQFSLRLGADSNEETLNETRELTAKLNATARRKKQRLCGSENSSISNGIRDDNKDTTQVQRPSLGNFANATREVFVANANAVDSTKSGASGNPELSTGND